MGKAGLAGLHGQVFQENHKIDWSLEFGGSIRLHEMCTAGIPVQLATTECLYLSLIRLTHDPFFIVFGINQYKSHMVDTRYVGIYVSFRDFVKSLK